MKVYTAILVLCWFEGYLSATIDQILQKSINITGGFMGSSGSLVRTELDILIRRPEYQRLNRPRQKRKALKDIKKRWPNGVVPFMIILQHFSPVEVIEIIKAMEHWHQYTCINFRVMQFDDVNKVKIQDGPLCGAEVGMQGGEQLLYLGHGCSVKSVVIHELGHVVGLYHEHSRPDRDRYVKIIKSNIQEGEERNFRLYPEEINTYNIKYDYKSIMHYGETYFSKNGHATLQAKDPRMQNIMGTAETLSYDDIKLVHEIYGCSSHCKDPPPCGEHGFVGKDCKCWYPGKPISYLDTVGSSTCLRLGQYKQPVLDLVANITVPLHVVALEDGGAVVVKMHQRKYVTVRIDQTGQEVKVYFRSNLNNKTRIVMGPDDIMFALHRQGVISKINIEDGAILKTYQIPGMRSSATGVLIGGDKLLLTDQARRVFTFNGANGQTSSLKTKIFNVVSMHDKSQDIYVLCDPQNNTLRIYNTSWHHLRDIKHEMLSPYYVIASPHDTLWIADKRNYRVSEYSTRGRFIRHLITGIDEPLSISYSYPHMWVLCRVKGGRVRGSATSNRAYWLKRYKIYKE